MKVQQCSSENACLSQKSAQQPNKEPSFQAGLGDWAFNSAGLAMQKVQNSGFIASFLIQDGLGMTAPRVGTAFLRDKEVTGEYNFQEGKEVLLREGLTGPIMMAMAPLMLLISSKFGKSTTINSQLIKRFGNSFKELISKPEFNKDLLSNKEALQKNYWEHNIRSMLSNTLGKDNYNEKDVEFIIEQMLKYENPPQKLDVKGIFKKRNYKRKCIGNIESYINDLKYKSSADLDMLDKLKVGKDDTVRTYKTRDSIEALLKYSDDVIKDNKHLAEMNEEMAENFKNKSVGKRFIATIATIAATLGVMSYIPKIYAKSDIAPGARTAMQMKEMDNKGESQSSDLATENASVTEENISFKGKAPKNGKNWLSSLGKFLGDHQNENFSSELEYDGHNFTNTLMAALSVFGLLFPRGIRAYNRAQVDENGKKDLTELYEILIRDLASSLSVIFAVPMLTRAFVTSYEHKSGFVLMNKDREQSKLKTALDLINPYSKSHVLSNNELESLYFGVDSKEKMLNFCEYIDKNHGDLQKIFSKSEYSNELFNDNAIDLKKIEKLSKNDKNKEIIKFIKNWGNESKESKKKVDASIKKLMQSADFKIEGNKLLSYAKGLNSMPAFITTFAISPIILGWFIPRLTYANTRRIHAKKEKRAAEAKINTAA